MGNVDRYCGCRSDHRLGSDLLATHERNASHAARRRNDHNHTAGHVDCARYAAGKSVSASNSASGNSAGHGASAGNATGDPGNATGEPAGAAVMKRPPSSAGFSFPS
jgi:hypothetical protein